MKFIAISDIHGTSKTPRSRLGNPLLDFYNKMEWVFKLSSKLNDTPIICAGDVFDSPRDILALYRFITLKQKYRKTLFFTVYGQHDLYFRNKELVTNLGILFKAGLIILLDKFPYTFHYTEKHKKDIDLYGCNWGEEVPRVEDKSKINILSIHAPIYTEPLFPKHEFTKVKKWQKKNKDFDFVICGDIHRSFVATRKEQIICNTGPIMRLESSEYMMKHRPMVFVYNTEKEIVEKKYIPCTPSEEVLDPNVKTINEHKIDLGDSFNFDRPTNKTNIIEIIQQLIKTKASDEKQILKILSEISGEDKWI
jgi:DNA repair exonuclease SbcCD nuclease subunit